MAGGHKVAEIEETEMRSQCEHTASRFLFDDPGVVVEGDVVVLVVVVDQPVVVVVGVEIVEPQFQLYHEDVDFLTS